jgi:hypothetical protein
VAVHGLVFRDVRNISVYSCGGGVDNTWNASSSGSEEDVEGSVYVDGVVEKRVLHAARNGDGGSLVKYDVFIRHDSVESGGVPYVSLYEDKVREVESFEKVFWRA